MNLIYDTLVQYKISHNDAVMFDIDDTLIGSSDGYVKSEILHILNFARKLGYKIIIITARSPDTIGYTSTQLGLLNINYDLLIFSEPEMKGRVKIRTGYRYVLSVGDLLTDCTDSIFSLKLPEMILTGPQDLQQD